MYLLLELGRLDVWPVDDLGVRHGYGVAWQLDPLDLDLAQPPAVCRQRVIVAGLRLLAVAQVVLFRRTSPCRRSARRSSRGRCCRWH